MHLQNGKTVGDVPCSQILSGGSEWCACASAHFRAWGHKHELTAGCGLNQHGIKHVAHTGTREQLRAEAGK